MICIYQIRNTINNKIYIGSTKSLKKRQTKHIRDLRTDDHHNIHLQRCFNKTQDESVYVFEIIEECSADELFEREEFWIDKLKPEYNIGGVCGGDNYTNHPEKEKLRKRLAKQLRECKKPKPKYGKDNPNWRGGKTFFTCPVCNKEIRIASQHAKPKTCAECRDRTGDKNPFHGKQHSKKSKEIMRKKQLGKKPINSKTITIDGTTYKSYADAARALGVSMGTISYRVKNGTYKET